MEIEDQKKMNEEPPEADDKAEPLGAVVRVSGEGPAARKHFSSFLYDGLQFDLEDSVLIAPQEGCLKPSVAIIKNIAQTEEGEMKITVQTFYRPEESDLPDGENSEPIDGREIFYSFEKVELHGESVMHKCVVHFLPPDIQIPQRKQHPGFITRRVYDPLHKRLTMLNSQRYNVDQRQQIDHRVQKTLAQLRSLPELDLTV